MTRTKAIKIILLVLLLSSSQGFVNATTTTTTTIFNSTGVELAGNEPVASYSSCPTKCEDCGSRAIRCVLDLSKCPITCQCREGYSGERCDIIDNELALKRHVWSTMLEESKTTLISFSAYNGLIKRLAQLVTDLTQSSQSTRPLDSHDIGQIGEVIAQIWRLNQRRAYLNSKRTVESLLHILDRLLTITPDSPSMQASIRSVIDRIDRLGKYFGRENEDNFHVRLPALEALVASFSSNVSQSDWIELRSSGNASESISVNRQVVIAGSLESDKPAIRIVLRIYSLTMVNLLVFFYIMKPMGPCNRFIISVLKSIISQGFQQLTR